MVGTQLERVDEDRSVKQAKRHGYVVFKLAFLGVRGAPDRIYGKNGVTRAIEWKKEGEEPTKQQQLRANDLSMEFGWQVCWCDNYEEACRFLMIPME